MSCVERFILSTPSSSKVDDINLSTHDIASFYENKFFYENYFNIRNMVF